MYAYHIFNFFIPMILMTIPGMSMLSHFPVCLIKCSTMYIYITVRKI